jgi:hypothetical protein
MIKALANDGLFVAGGALVCWGMAKISVPAGMISAGLVLIAIAISVTVGQKK